MNHRLFLLAVFVAASANGRWRSPPQAADAAAGEAVFKSQCSICHSVQAGRNQVGPSLAGIVGRQAGQVAEFSLFACQQGLRADLGRSDARSLPDESERRRAAYDHDLWRPEGRRQARQPDRLSGHFALMR